MNKLSEIILNWHDLVQKEYFSDSFRERTCVPMHLSNEH